jgi:glycosyltransferase involved in cell wall biosynthesis
MAERSVAYVLKGYPRMSELFIASEIWRLEQLGVNLRLIVLKSADEVDHHAVVDRIKAVPSYLPPLTTMSDRSLLSWLRGNAGPYLPALAAVARRHPVRLARAAAASAAQSVRARKRWRPRAIYLKEFLEAVEVADRVERAGDVIHLHGHFAHGATTVTWLTSMITGLPFSFTGHAKDIYQAKLNPAGLLARKMRAASYVITCTTANRDHLLAVEPTAAVRVVHHGLNADFARLLDGPTEDEDNGEHRTGERLRIVSVGRLVPKKGFEVLVDAVALLRARGVDCELVIAGEDGDATEAIQHRITALRLHAHVTMLGPQSQTQLLALYRSATLFALACHVEEDGDRDGIPNVLVEAMAAGVPVVSTAVSGIPELVQSGQNGLLVAPDDPAALADAMHRVHKDPALRAQLVASGRLTVTERFDGDRLARQLAALLPAACR